LATIALGGSSFFSGLLDPPFVAPPVLALVGLSFLSLLAAALFDGVFAAGCTTGRTMDKWSY
jgi:hypothetical protein